MAPIRGLFDDHKNDPKEKKNTVSYAGGSRSGIGIENPDDVKDVPQTLATTMYTNAILIDNKYCWILSPAEIEVYRNEMVGGQIPALFHRCPAVIALAARGLDSVAVTVSVREENIPEHELKKCVLMNEDSVSKASPGPGITPAPGPSQAGRLLGSSAGPASATRAEVHDSIPAMSKSGSTINLNLRLPDGSRRTLAVDPSDSVENLIKHLGTHLKTKVSLSIGFPPKVVSDHSVKLSGLISETILVKVVQ